MHLPGCPSSFTDFSGFLLHSQGNLASQARTGMKGPSSPESLTAHRTRGGRKVALLSMGPCLAASKALHWAGSREAPGLPTELGFGYSQLLHCPLPGHGLRNPPREKLGLPNQKQTCLPQATGTWICPRGRAQRHKRPHAPKYRQEATALLPRAL